MNAPAFLQSRDRLLRLGASLLLTTARSSMPSPLTSPATFTPP